MAVQRIRQWPLLVKVKDLLVKAKDIVIYCIDRLDRKLEQWPVLTSFEQCTAIPKTSVVLGGIGSLVLLHCFEASGAPVSNLIGWAAPAYLSLKAIETPSPHENAQWITYWTVFSFFNVVESLALGVVLSYEPRYFAYKSLFILWLWLPLFRGALGVYFTIIRPVLTIASSLSNGAATTNPETVACPE